MELCVFFVLENDGCMYVYIHYGPFIGCRWRDAFARGKIAVLLTPGVGVWKFDAKSGETRPLRVTTSQKCFDNHIHGFMNRQNVFSTFTYLLVKAVEYLLFFLLGFLEICQNVSHISYRKSSSLEARRRFTTISFEPFQILG